MTENSDIVMSLNATYSCHLLLKIVSSNAELMVWERRDFITLNQKMAAAASLYSFAEVTRKDIVPILCLKPSLVNASYKRRASDFTISFREFGFPSEELVHCTSVDQNRKHLHKHLVKMKTAASVSAFSMIRAPCEKSSCWTGSHLASIWEKPCVNWSLRCENEQNSQKRKDLSHLVTGFPAVAATACSSHIDRTTADFEVLTNVRKKFCEEVSFRRKDRDVSLAKAMLLIGAEDEAFISFNRNMDVRAVLNEGREGVDSANIPYEWASVDALPLAGKSISAWLSEFDIIANQVKADLVSKETGCHLVQVLETVNAVIFDLRGFTRSSSLKDPKQSYLHTVLSFASGTGVVSDQQTIVSIPCVDLGSHLLRVLYDWMGVSNWLESYAALMLSIVYIEVCRRLGVTIVGAPVGEDFLIWPQTENPEELFKLSQGESWFARVNGSCVKHPQSKASDLNSRSLKTLELGSNRDIIGIALANLKRLYWKRASRAHPGLLLTSPLRPVHHTLEKTGKAANSSVLMLRPQELRLSTMASERLLILQPHNWALRRDHGMLLYHSRRYGEAVQELSICMAFAPVEEAEILEPFVEKLHLMRLESSWKSVKTSSTLTPRP